MSDAIKAIEALRDAARTRKESSDGIVRAHAEFLEVTAIAALRAEQPDAAASKDPGIASREQAAGPSAHEVYRAGPDDLPTARTEVPPMPEQHDLRYGEVGVYSHKEVRALHAAAVATAERAKDWEEEARRENQNAAYQRSQREQAERERDEARAQLADCRELLDAERGDLAAARSEMTQRCERAERRMVEMAEPGFIGAFAARDAALAQLAEAQAKLKALEEQEPVAWWWIEDGVMHQPSVAQAVFGSKPPHSCNPLFAAAGAAQDGKAALRNERRKERERCARLCEGLAMDARQTSDRFESHGDRERSHQWEQRRAQANECARVIRALPEED